MRAIAKVLSGSLFCLLAAAIVTQAEARALQDPPPAQNPGSAQGAGTGQAPGRGGERRPGLFGKLTAVHDQSIEITQQSGDAVTVKIGSSTQFRKEGAAARLSDFKIGDMVFVRGAENPDHTWTAEMIGTRPSGGFGGGQGGGGRQGGRGASGGGPGGGMPGRAGVLGQDYVFGEVKSIDAPKLTILRTDNVTQTVELNEETSLRKGRDSITMADIQVGDHVFVRGGMANNVFQPKSVNVIGPEQWKVMQEMGMAGGPPANPQKDNNQPQKPPEPPH
jgi:preprotein translocase subunit YajC